MPIFEGRQVGAQEFMDLHAAKNAAAAQEVGASGPGAAQEPHPGPADLPYGRLPAFGGESRGFTTDVTALASSFFYGNTALADGMSIPIGMEQTEIPRSLINTYALFNFKGLHYGLDTDPQSIAGGFRDSTPINGWNASKNLTMSKIIQFFGERWPHIAYKPADFLYGKYYKKIPVNHLITLRRFAQPCYDNIYDLKIRPHEDAEGGVDGTQPAGVTAVTYMGDAAGNPLPDILNYSYGLTYEEETAEMESHDSGGGGYTQQPFYSDMTGIGKATADVFKKVNAGDKFRAQNFKGQDVLSTTYANFVLGPVNVVNKTFVRKQGLKFANDITLNFEYALKSLAYVNPKLAMIDVMTNMMTMTYNNGQFFGGSHRFYGSAGFVASQFGDINMLRQGNFSGYVGSVVEDVSQGFNNTFGDGNGGFSLPDFGEGLLEIGKQFLGNMLGKFLGDNMGSGTGSFATKAFISAEPTGDWHVTIGNPLNPITMMGNMIIDNTNMTLGKGLGADDFPTEVKFAITCKHGKPRDKGDMENMFNMGRGKIYASPKGEKDILNLEGLDVAVSGAYNPTGDQGVQSSGQGDGSSAPGNNNNGRAPDEIDLGEASTQSQIAQGDGTSAEYVRNMIGMIIDS